MKAILSWGAGSLGLLLFATFSQAYVWVTPVTKCPYPQAPSTYNSGFYLVDPWCRVTGPHYYLVPPCGPFQGVLPGPVGQGIQTGYLPHTVLQAKDGMSMGNMPMLGQKQQAPSGPPQGAPMPYGRPMPYPGPQAYGPMQPFGPAQPFGAMQPFQQFGQFAPMPPMGYPPPRPPAMGGGMYPTHPFTRSPRDFFMWGDAMEEERARGNRPFPVP